MSERLRHHRLLVLARDVDVAAGARLGALELVVGLRTQRIVAHFGRHLSHERCDDGKYEGDYGRPETEGHVDLQVRKIPLDEASSSRRWISIPFGVGVRAPVERLPPG